MCLKNMDLDAPVDSFANAFANAGYMLWHANQAGRYNILHGIKAPQSGFWKNNPHADCIDYQIESDFAGLMSPGMPNIASSISDKIGHIMNYGDGWYGGVFVGAMYTLAFTSGDINYIVNEALKTIPPQSEFYQCIHDVIGWHKQYPDDWKQTWFLIQKKWANDIGCPEGIFKPFNIDAKVNAAYVVIGLLYGDGDFTKSLEITTRCGQDADCNPSTVGGILGALYGYDKIPAYWKQGLKEAEDIDFKYTTMSLNNVYNIGLKHALQNIERNGGRVEGDKIIIKTQKPVAVKFEKSFDGLYPLGTTAVKWNDAKDEISFSYEGTGFVLRGETAEWNNNTDFVFNTALYVDGKLIEKPQLPASYTTRRYELCWNYDLPKGKHDVQLKILNPSNDYHINNVEAIYYSDKPVDGMKENEWLHAIKHIVNNIQHININKTTCHVYCYNYTLAIVFCFITMLCWGSWANTQKLAGKNWRFELFYWDYVIGILLFSVFSAFTLGSNGDKGRSFLTDIQQASQQQYHKRIYWRYYF